MHQRVLLECHSGDREVMGSSLTHCTAEYGTWQATHAHVPLLPSSIYLLLVRRGYALKVGG